MKKPNIKKLKYPLWFHIVFYCLTVIVPLVAILIQGFKSNSTLFKFTFVMICAAVILWIFARKFLIANLEEKMQARKAALEHDYEIEVGNPEKAKWLWFNNEMWLSIINAIHVALIGLLIFVCAWGVESAAIQIKGVGILITLLYIMAYVLKFILIVKLRGQEQEEEVKDETPKQ